MVRARNIHTVGDLSSLTEREIDSLPIRSPKVATVRRVLQTFESRTKPIKQSPLATDKSTEMNRTEKRSSSGVYFIKILPFTDFANDKK